MPENHLKKKVGSGGFDPASLTSAQNMIENNTVDFAPLALEMSNELAALLAKARSKDLDETDLMDKIMYPIMQLKAQGGLFHYPSISAISHIVIDFLENIPELDEISIEIAEVYQKSINLIVAMKIKDENSREAKALCQEMDKACNRYYKLKELD